MPIHLSILNPRQAEAGKIKIGRLGDERDARNGGKYQLPEKQDHFTLTTTERGADGNFEIDTVLMEQLQNDPECVDKDGKIRRLPILLSSDDIESVFPTSLACYSGRNAHCRGDGKSATRYELKKENRNGRPVTVKTGKTSKVACPCSYLEAEATDGYVCKPHATLWATVVAGPETQIGARHSFRTTSWDSIRSILAGLQEIQRMIGTLVGPQLWLYVRPRKVTLKNGTVQTVHVVHVRCKARDIQELRERVLQQAKLRHDVAMIAGRPIRLGLPGPAESESDLDQSDIQQEYHPEDEDSDGSILFDPETGEVIEADFVASPSPEDESQEEKLHPEHVELPDEHPVRTALMDLCRKAAIARDFDPESADQMSRGSKEIYQEACESAEMPRLPWRSVTISRARKISHELMSIIESAPLDDSGVEE